MLPSVGLGKRRWRYRETIAPLLYGIDDSGRWFVDVAKAAGFLTYSAERLFIGLRSNFLVVMSVFFKGDRNYGLPSI